MYVQVSCILPRGYDGNSGNLIADIVQHAEITNTSYHMAKRIYSCGLKENPQEHDVFAHQLDTLSSIPC